MRMASPLAEKSCVPCRGGIPPLSRDEAELFHEQAPDWALLDHATRIERTYRFKNFREAFAFVERAAGFLVHHSPITNQERWEESAGYSPSTLAAIIASLVCAADFARARSD